MTFYNITIAISEYKDRCVLFWIGLNVCVFDWNVLCIRLHNKSGMTNTRPIAPWLFCLAVHWPMTSAQLTPVNGRDIRKYLVSFNRTEGGGHKVTGGKWPNRREDRFNPLQTSEKIRNLQLIFIVFCTVFYTRASSHRPCTLVADNRDHQKCSLSLVVNWHMPYVFIVYFLG